MNKTFYITTPIYYPNGEPHLGIHTRPSPPTPSPAITASPARRLFSSPARTSTGSRWSRPPPLKASSRACWPTRWSPPSRNFWKEIGITHDDFIRTTEDRHKSAVQEIVRRLVANDDIYLGSYEGWYDEGQEEFVTETEAKIARIQIRHQRPAADAVFREELFLPSEEIRSARAAIHRIQPRFHPA